MSEKINVIKTGIDEVEITEKWGSGEAHQMNDDVEPIESFSTKNK